MPFDVRLTGRPPRVRNSGGGVEQFSSKFLEVGDQDRLRPLGEGRRRRLAGLGAVQREGRPHGVPADLRERQVIYEAGLAVDWRSVAVKGRFTPAAALRQLFAGSGLSPKYMTRCVDVVIGREKSFDCVNEKLKRQVDRVNPPELNTPPIDARSSDLKTGVVNVPAVQQQYGKNFGVSAFPYRPPPPVYGMPVAPMGHR